MQGLNSSKEDRVSVEPLWTLIVPVISCHPVDAKVRHGQPQLAKRQLHPTGWRRRHFDDRQERMSRRRKIDSLSKLSLAEQIQEWLDAEHQRLLNEVYFAVDPRVEMTADDYDRADESEDLQNAFEDFDDEIVDWFEGWCV